MSNINKLPFNENGPVVVSPADFELYRTAVVPGKNSKRYENPYQALTDWIVRPIRNDGIRRLCLRDLLRQGFKHSRGYFDMGVDLDIVLRLDSHGGLYQALSDSEKHRTEFIEEAMYTINHDLLPLSENRVKGEFLGFLIILQHDFNVKEINADQLWQLHPINSHHKNPFIDAGNDLDFCLRGLCLNIPGANTPPRFYNEVWQRLEATIIENLALCHDAIKERGNVFSARHPFKQHIFYVTPPSSPESLVIRFCQLAIMHYQTDFAARAIPLLESHLNPNIQYVPATYLPKVLPRLSDLDVTFCCLERHLRLFPEKYIVSQFSTQPDFVLWSIGLYHKYRHHHPEHSDNIVSQRLAELL